MADTITQASFNSGEWSPKLFARVDVAKYRSAAALLQNYFVDYRGGASTRPGTKYIQQAYNSAAKVRIIPFQASFSIGYLLEFGAGYVRFYYQGTPVLETATSITSAASGPPEVFTDTAHGYNDNDWIFVAGNYYIVQGATTNTFTLTDLFGNAINTNPFTLPVNASRVYTITSPYAASELAIVKFAQNVNMMVLCHPNHPPYVLTLNTATNWTLTAITFGSAITAPTSPAVTESSGLSSGSTYYSYVVTSVDGNGQESGPSTPANGGPWADMRSVAGSTKITWSAVTGAVSYNIYKSIVSYFTTVPGGVQYGFIGNVTGTQMIDSNISADYSTCPPIAENPFSGSGVQTITLTSAGSGYTAVPTLTLTAAPPGGTTATATVQAIASTPVLTSGGSNFSANQPNLNICYFTGGLSIQVKSIGPGGTITSYIIITPPTSPISSGSLVTTATYLYSNGYQPSNAAGATFSINWSTANISLTNAGAGYLTAPSVTFSGGSPGSGAAATTTLGAASSGNPTVPTFFQQRLVLAGPPGSPQQFNMSQTGNYFNFDVSNPVQADDAIQGTLVSGVLNAIKSLISMPSGMIALTDRLAYLINGGTAGTAVTPSAITAQAQAYNGASDVPPIVANYDVLYVQAKGSIVRDLAYNFYINVYTGTDISVLSSHLFYGYTVNEWAWAEEPFKVVWAVRSDGTMLTLTFLKEQDFIGWTHSVTTNGSFQSVAVVTEQTADAGVVDAVYTVVQRVIEGQTLQYIERVSERIFPNGVVDAWCVDCGIQYVGTPATNFSGAQFLAGQTVTGLADGVIIPPFTMPSNGAFTLATAASKVTIGLGYNCDLQTMPLDIGEPTVQGKVKQINAVDVRVAETLGLSIGADFNSLVPMKDLVQGNVSSMLTGQATQVVTNLVNGDARTYLNSTYTVPGQYCIRQSNPMPATILGVIPIFDIGDTPGGRR